MERLCSTRLFMPVARYSVAQGLFMPVARYSVAQGLFMPVARYSVAQGLFMPVARYTMTFHACGKIYNDFSCLWQDIV